MKIRTAGVDDLDACVSLTAEFHAESVFWELPLSRGKAYERLMMVF